MQENSSSRLYTFLFILAGFIAPIHFASANSCEVALDEAASRHQAQAAEYKDGEPVRDFKSLAKRGWNNPISALFQGIEPFRDFMLHLAHIERGLKAENYIREDENIRPEELGMFVDLFPEITRYLVGHNNSEVELLAHNRIVDAKNQIAEIKFLAENKNRKLTGDEVATIAQLEDTIQKNRLMIQSPYGYRTSRLRGPGRGRDEQGMTLLAEEHENPNVYSELVAGLAGRMVERTLKTYQDPAEREKSDANLKRVVSNARKLVESRKENELLVLQMTPEEASTFYRELLILKAKGGKNAKLAEKALNEIEFISPIVRNSLVRNEQLVSLRQAVNQAYRQEVFSPEYMQVQRNREKLIKTRLLEIAKDPIKRASFMKIYFPTVRDMVEESQGGKVPSKTTSLIAKLATGESYRSFEGAITRATITENMIRELINIFEKAGIEVSSFEKGRLHSFEEQANAREKEDQHSEEVQARLSSEGVETLVEKLEVLSSKDTEGYWKSMMLIREYVRYDAARGEYDWADASHGLIPHFTEAFVTEMATKSTKKGRENYKQYIASILDALREKNLPEGEWEAAAQPLIDLLRPTEPLEAGKEPLFAKAGDLFGSPVEVSQWLQIANQRLYGIHLRYDQSKPFDSNNATRVDSPYRAVSAGKAFGEDPLREQWHAMGYWARFYDTFRDIPGHTVNQLAISKQNNSESPRVVVLLDIANFGQYRLADALPSSKALQREGIETVILGTSTEVYGTAEKTPGYTPEQLQAAALLKNRDPQFHKALMDSNNPAIQKFADSDAMILDQTLHRLSQVFGAYESSGLGIKMLNTHDVEVKVDAAGTAKKKSFWRFW